MIMFPYCSAIETRNKTGEWYYLRLNSACAKAFNGATYVHIGKTVDGRFIVIEPILDPGAKRTKNTSKVIVEPSGAIRLACTRFVSSRFFPEYIFGKRYRVKKDKAGKIYICLQEEVGDD